MTADLLRAAVLLAMCAGCIKLQQDKKCAGPAANVQWTITGSQGGTLDCDSAGAANVTLYLSDFNQTFPCGVGAGRTRKLPLGGVYTQHGQLLALNGDTLAETSPVQVTIDDCDVTPVPDLQFALSACNAPSSVQVNSWVILDGSGNPTDCDTVGAASVVLYLGSTMVTFPCSQYSGQADNVNSGTYDTHLALVSSSGANLSVTDSMSITVPCGSPRSIDGVQFPVN